MVTDASKWRTRRPGNLASGEFPAGRPVTPENVLSQALFGIARQAKFPQADSRTVSAFCW